VLDGTLNVVTTAGASFDPGVYRVISYAGSLTNNGLAIGTIPSPGFFVQTSVDHQVNLINTAGLTLNYWDGSVPAEKNNGAVNGGDGVWQNSAGNDNWTNIDGTVNAPFTDASFAVFMATPGTVTVDDSLGDVTVSGMQGGFNRSSQHRYHTVPQGTGRGFRPASSIRASSLASCSRHERRHQVRLSSVD
jgi:hypothetical protein